VTNEKSIRHKVTNEKSLRHKVNTWNYHTLWPKNNLIWFDLIYCV
jgi:hypothetical protein